MGVRAAGGTVLATDLRGHGGARGRRAVPDACYLGERSIHGTGFAFQLATNQEHTSVALESFVGVAGARGKVAGAAREKRQAMMIFQHRIPLSGGARHSRGNDRGAQDSASEQYMEATRARRFVERRFVARTSFGALFEALAGPTTRRFVLHHAASVGILGGILCTPAISVLAWVGMVLPAKAALHQLAPVLIATALVWLALAIILAHACRPTQGRQPLDRLSEPII